MFAVNGIGGEMFRGSLEKLLEIHATPSLSRAHGVREDADEPLAEPPASSEEKRRYHAAAAAYVAALKPAPDRGPIYHAYQVMTRGVLTIPSDAGVERAWRTLASRGVGQAPVIDRNRRLVGLVARSHLLHVLNEEDGRVRDVLSRTVANVMATPVVTANPVTDVRQIARVMLEYGLPAVPVVDESSALVGIVSRGDILRVVVSDPPLTLWG